MAIDAKLKRRMRDEGRETKGKSSIVRAKRSSIVSRLNWEVYINGGRTPTGLDAVRWAKRCEKLGAGEILLTSMDADGTKDGFDLDLTRTITNVVKIPVIASGGAGSLKDFFEVFDRTKATAALAASIFHYRQIKISEIKKYLKNKGVMVRR